MQSAFFDVRQTDARDAMARLAAYRHKFATDVCCVSKRRTTNPAVRNRGVASMCDYSLDFVASRPAKVGDKLVTTKFKNSVTRGFAAVEEPTVAVCVLPGTEIAFEQEVEYCHSLLPNQKVAERLARFRQINLEQASVHHDALEFPDGKIILLARLCEGQHATVLQLPASPRATNEAEQQKRGSLVT
jgi:hypothetical protein